MTTDYIVVLDDGETYSSVHGAVTLWLAEPDDDEVRELYHEGEPVVPMSELLDAMEATMHELGIGHLAESVKAEIEYYVTNTYGS